MSFESYLDEYFNGFDEGDTFLVIDDNKKAIEYDFIEFIKSPIPIVILYNNRNVRFTLTDIDITKTGTIITGKFQDKRYTILDKATFAWVTNKIK